MKQTIDLPVPQIQDHVVEEIIGIPVPRVMEDFSVTLELGAAKAEEVVALASVTLIIQVVFAQMFGIDVSMITVSSVEAHVCKCHSRRVQCNWKWCVDIHNV